MGLVFVNILQLFVLQLLYTQQAGACLTSGVTIPTTWWYFSLPPLLWLVISWCATCMRSWSPTANSQKALTHSLSFSWTVLSGPCIRVCYNQNIELHPGPCPAVVHFSEGIESVHRKSRELYFFCFCIWKWPLPLLFWVFHYLKAAQFWQRWATCWVIHCSKSGQWHHDILWQEQCLYPNVWVRL